MEQAHIDRIKTAFSRMRSKEDLLQLLNEAKSIVYGEKATPFKMKQLTWHANPKLGGKRYTEFKIKKKSGAHRTIHAPASGLKALQKTLGFILQCIYEPHSAATGFVRDRSIVDNAKLHVGNKYIYNIDLKNFFPSVDQARVWKCLQLKPFSLSVSDPIQKTKIAENSRIIPIHLPIKKLDDSLKGVVIGLKYEGYRFLKGLWNLQLKAGGNILYKIDEDAEKEFHGIIYVYKEKSSYPNITELAEEGAIKNDIDAEIILQIYLGQLIEVHQNKLLESNPKTKLANLIANICCTEMEVERRNEIGEWVTVKRNVLPQGAPTSPILTNVICQRLDFLLTGVAKRFGLKYSRYADDITFSSMHNVFQADGDFIKELHRIIAEQGFQIKESKTRLQKEGYRKEVTGLLVNEKVNVQKRYIKQLRMWLYYWERYGYDRAYGYFIQQYLRDRTNIKGKPNMANVISGKLEYLKMVKGEDNDAYLKLRERFNILTNKTDHIAELLSLWESEGIEKAMENYYQNKSFGK